MYDIAAALVVQQLAEFLGALSAVSDVPNSYRIATMRAARALDAEMVAVLRGGAIAAAVGFPAGQAPVRDLLAVVSGEQATVDVPGCGPCRAIVAPSTDEPAEYLVVARSAPDGFTVEEVSLVRGMARVLELHVHMVQSLAAERRQAARNSELVESLSERQRLLEHLSGIQRAIARRAPLARVLDMIAVGAHEMLGEDGVALWLLDDDEPDMLVMASEIGLPKQIARRRPAILDDGLPTGADPGVVSLAVPVHQSGTVVGALEVTAYGSGREYGKRDEDILHAFAEHASLAITDAKTFHALNKASHDQVTGLVSRSPFMEQLQRGLSIAGRAGDRLGLLFVDLDGFKLVNDSLGHAAGDAVLAEVAARLRACVRSIDTVARLGGDEFAILLAGFETEDEVIAVADRVLDQIGRPFDLTGQDIFIGASVGVTFSTPASPDADALVRDADLAMYHAKRTGKGRYEVFRSEMQEAFEKTVNLATDLRLALERDEFVVYYQPICALADGELTGLEALVRWRHPTRGLVAPMDFIPAAEETGLIIPIGHRVLYEACRSTSAWNQRRALAGMPELTIHVNVSTRQLRDDTAGLVAEVLRETGLAASRLVLEITESHPALDLAKVREQLLRFKDLGVGLAIDDFGTGYSSLLALRQFPVDTIKVDKSFVDDVDGYDSDLTRAIVGLGLTVRRGVIAEGVESESQRAALLDYGCLLGQGYLFAPPLDHAATTALVSEEPAARGPEPI
ncbi:putative bifunctional diguanylate cyclase/phosphodiesterase [Actinoplanes sp. CA-030573]|uniref:putative bifunctional diguanylate cyclase/phosphodiesterase n=1 Tax=Actinoplanes sp. CA-030573 TaxID=3239898 RepID=UPI003D904C26